MSNKRTGHLVAVVRDTTKEVASRYAARQAHLPV